MTSTTYHQSTYAYRIEHYFTSYTVAFLLSAAKIFYGPPWCSLALSKVILYRMYSTKQEWRRCPKTTSVPYLRWLYIICGHSIHHRRSIINCWAAHDTSKHSLWICRAKPVTVLRGTQQQPSPWFVSPTGKYSLAARFSNTHHHWSPGINGRP